MSSLSLTKSQKKTLNKIGVEWESQSDLVKKGVCKSSLLTLYCKQKVDKQSLNGEDHYKLRKK
jgi:hypothetical protein